MVDVHRHLGKDETFVLLRGRVVVKTYNDDVSVIESVELCPNDGKYRVNNPRGDGIRWSLWNLGVASLSAKRGRLWGMRWMGYWK